MGEIDGAILDSGTVIHWPPHLADRFSGVAVRGDRIRVTGWMETGPEGDTQLEVRTITNVRTNASIANDGPALRRRRLAQARGKGLFHCRHRIARPSIQNPTRPADRFRELSSN